MPFSIEGIELFHDFSPAELSAVKSCLVEKNFEKGEILHSEGTSCMGPFFVRAGKVKIYRSSFSGNEQILEMLGPGETCVCNPGQTKWCCTASAQAATPCSVWFLSRENYIRMVTDNPKLSHALNQLFAKRLQYFTGLIEEFTLKDSKKRLIKFFLDMLAEKKNKSRKNDVLFISATREELAHRLGVARETIARHISELKHKNLIDVKPFQIIIRDREALEKILG